MDIKIASDDFWFNRKTIATHISNQEYAKDFTWHDGTWVFKWRLIVEGLYFQPEPYAPRPQIDKNGYPIWKRVVQYNSCYLKYEGNIENRSETTKN